MKHPLVLLAAATVVAFALLWFVNIDPFIMAIIIAAYGFSCLWQLILTGWRFWTVLGAGLFASELGVSLYFGYLLTRRLTTEPPFDEAGLTLVRALVLVGGLFVLAGWRLRSHGREGDVPGAAV